MRTIADLLAAVGFAIAGSVLAMVITFFGGFAVVFCVSFIAPQSVVYNLGMAASVLPAVTGVLGFFGGAIYALKRMKKREETAGDTKGFPVIHRR